MGQITFALALPLACHRHSPWFTLSLFRFHGLSLVCCGAHGVRVWVLYLFCLLGVCVSCPSVCVQHSCITKKKAAPVGGHWAFDVFSQTTSPRKPKKKEEAIAHSDPCGEAHERAGSRVQARPSASNTRQHPPLTPLPCPAACSSASSSSPHVTRHTTQQRGCPPPPPPFTQHNHPRQHATKRRRRCSTGSTPRR